MRIRLSQKSQCLKYGTGAILDADRLRLQDHVIVVVVQLIQERLFDLGDLVILQQPFCLSGGEQGADARHFLGIAQRLILGQRGDCRQDLYHSRVKVGDQRFQRLVALLPAGITLFFMLALCAVLKTLQTGEQDIYEVVLEPIILMGDKSDEVKIAVRIVTTSQLKDLGFDDAVGKVLDTVLVERQPIQHGFERLIKPLYQIKIRHTLLDFRRLGRLREFLHQRQFIGAGFPGCRSLVVGFLNQKGIQQCPHLIGQRTLDNSNQRPVMTIDGP
jgi:hypothetical protein